MTRSNIRFPPLPPCWSRRAAFSSGIGVKVSHDRCKRRSPAAPPGRGIVFRARRRGDRIGRLARPRHGRGHVPQGYRAPHSPHAAGGVLDDRGVEASVTPIGGWGPWIDGGGWLVVGGVHVDLLYRDLDRVGAAIDDAQTGKVERFYQPGHPHAFLPTIYMGEAACARLLHDPAGTLAALQRRTTPYPAALAGALRERFEWEAEFALANARKSLDRGDVSILAGWAFRAVACLCQTLFALNGVYLLNEKGAVAAAGGFARAPSSFAVRVAAVFADLGSGGPAARPDPLARPHLQKAGP